MVEGTLVRLEVEHLSKERDAGVVMVFEDRRHPR